MRGNFPISRWPFQLFFNWEIEFRLTSFLSGFSLSPFFCYFYRFSSARHGMFHNFARFLALLIRLESDRV